MALSKIQGINGQVTPNLGRRNMLINGDFQVWQRGTSGTVNSYTCDRWYGWGYQQALTRQQAENATSNTGRFALRNAHNDATSNQFSAIAQTLETNDTAKARGKKLTFSIDVKKGSAFTGTLSLQIVTRTDSEATINAGTRQVLVSEDITSSLTGSLQRFTCTTSSVVAQNALTCGVNVYHGGTSGTDANNYFQVERAQLEIGEEATEFESLPFMETLRLCERYFYMTYPHGATIGAASGESFLGRFLDGTQSYGSLQVPNVNMRAAPTKVIYNTATGTAGQIRTDTQNVAAAITGTGRKGGGWIYVNAVSVGTSTSIKSHLTMDAEF